MRIMVISDTESKSLWDYFDKSKVEDVDLIISCGDLKAEYLSFLVTLTSIPVLYVHGNHDVHYQTKPPEGCVCIEDDISVFQGVRILGLGGSMRYKPGDHQYSEKEMCRRVRRLRFKLLRNRGFDILVTHAPAYQINDGEDLPHRGFQCFRELMEKYRPRYMFHGHVHMSYGRKYKRYDRYQDTEIVNGYERCVVEFE